MRRSSLWMIAGAWGLLAQAAPATASNPALSHVAALAWSGVAQEEQPTLPLIEVGEWQVLALESGFLLVRAGGDTSTPQLVYATDGGNHDAPFEILAATGGNDLKQAGAILAEAYGLSEEDLAAIDALASEQDSPSGDPGPFKELTFEAASLLAAKTDAGMFNPWISAALSTWGSGQEAETIVVGEGFCKAGALLSVAGGGVAENLQAAFGFASTGSTDPGVRANTFVAAVAATCADVIPEPPWPPPVGPSFPIYPFPATPAPPTWTPPSGPGTPAWVGGPCTNFGQQTQCMNKAGELCMCSCEGAGAVGILVASGSSCREVPRELVGSPCSPAGGMGPCKSGSKTCACTCSPPPLAGAPAGSGSWTTPVNCSGSLELSLALAAVTLGLGWFLRRRLAACS